MTTEQLSQQNIKKVLIANRGEIAVRIIRACRELGIQTVSVYSDADRESLHVRYGDECYNIGAPPPSESYLNIDRLIETAKKAGADAIHPGYGFLSERAKFAQAVMDAGLTWIGPHPSSIERMGNKEEARETVKKHGVPIIPGTDPGLTDEQLIQAAHEQIQFPLMVKAAAGGGGKGMRVVRDPAELQSAIEAAKREAKAAFGDDTVYIERMIENARHIEIQVLGDMHGNIIHLFERECSIQRRNQKLVEEAPSPAPIMTEELRAKMGEMAVKAAQSVDYVGAGTIECLMDRTGNFYFMEMNTRIQVEHPVTELITGVDLVKEQIRIARGRRLSILQDQLRINGHAIECRITAEDPYNNFMPSVGRVTTHIPPTGPGIRVDTGIYEGYEVTPYYDSMLGKLICWGETRAAAVLRMRRALEEYKIMGLKTSLPFHQKLMGSLRFQAGNFDTKFVEERFEMSDGETAQPDVAAILAALVEHQARQQSAQIVQRPERDTSNWKWLGRWERIHR